MLVVVGQFIKQLVLFVSMLMQYYIYIFWVYFLWKIDVILNRSGLHVIDLASLLVSGLSHRMTLTVEGISKRIPYSISSSVVRLTSLLVAFSTNTRRS